MMTQVFVAAWIGVTVGWIGFGWALAQAPGDVRMAATVDVQELTVAEAVGVVKGA